MISWLATEEKKNLMLVIGFEAELVQVTERVGEASFPRITTRGPSIATWAGGTGRERQGYNCFKDHSSEIHYCAL